MARTRLKHFVTGGLRLNGCLVDDRYDPTTGCAYLVREATGPPGDVGFAKMMAGCACHLPVELLCTMVRGVKGDGVNKERVGAKK